MGCCGQNTKEKSYVDGVCSVCFELNNDSTAKKVFWCETCKAYICAKHKNAVGKRMATAAIVTGRQIINLLKK